MKYKVTEREKTRIQIDFGDGLFIEVYKSGMSYSNISRYALKIQEIKKMFKIANIERIKNNIRYLIRK